MGKLQTAEEPLTIAVTDLLSFGARLSFEISATPQSTLEPAGGAVTKVTVILAVTVPDTVTGAAAEGTGINAATQKQTTTTPSVPLRRKRRLIA